MCVYVLRYKLKVARDADYTKIGMILCMGWAIDPCFTGEMTIDRELIGGREKKSENGKGKGKGKGTRLTMNKEYSVVFYI